MVKSFKNIVNDPNLHLDDIRKKKKTLILKACQIVWLAYIVHLHFRVVFFFIDFKGMSICLAVFYA